MSQADEYRRRAAIAETKATAAQDEQAKEAYREAAERWRRLAEKAERNHW